MKRLLISSLVGAILVFGWQSVAHMFMHHHDKSFKVAPDQEKTIATLSGIFKEEGRYLIPRSSLDASGEEMEKFEESMKGKPFAMVTFNLNHQSNMGMSVLRGFATAFLCVLIFIWILGRNHGSAGSVLFKGVGLGFLMFIYIFYNQNIWWQTPWSVISGELIDCLVAWGLCGLWLGWWLNRSKL